jgi:hypothetical protein
VTEIFHDVNCYLLAQSPRMSPSKQSSTFISTALLSEKAEFHIRALAPTNGTTVMYLWMVHIETLNITHSKLVSRQTEIHLKVRRKQDELQCPTFGLHAEIRNSYLLITKNSNVMHYTAMQKGHYNTLVYIGYRISPSMSATVHYTHL